MSLNFGMNNSGKDQKEETLRGEIRQKIAKLFEQFKDWLKPKKDQPLIFQFVIFLVKLPVILVALALSPVFLLIILLAFFMAL
jgi:hypothetical protein